MLTIDIINILKKHNKNIKIYSESADPRLVAEIHNAGFNIHSVIKGAGSVSAGIDWMKGRRILITEHSLNTKREFDNYKYTQDKEQKYLNEPEDDFNHSIDAARYVVLMEKVGRNRRRQNLKQFYPV